MGQLLRMGWTQSQVSVSQRTALLGARKGWSVLLTSIRLLRGDHRVGWRGRGLGSIVSQNFPFRAAELKSRRMAIVVFVCASLFLILSFRIRGYHYAIGVNSRAWFLDHARSSAPVA